MKRWLILLALILFLVLLGVTARWWLAPLLAFVGANTDLIQGLTDGVQMFLWVGALVIAVLASLGFIRRPGQAPPAPSPAPTPPALPSTEHSEKRTVTSGDGSVSIGGDVTGNVIVNPSQEMLAAILRTPPPPDLTDMTRRYLAYLVDRYRYLDFRGMGVTDKAPLRLAVLDLYVPLRARIELPDGDTWSRRLHLAGRPVGDAEAAVMGERISEPLPVLDLLRDHDGLIILGDPGAGKTTTLKYLTLHLAAGNHAALGLPAHIPFLVPLSAYANQLAQSADNLPLDRFIAAYYADRGIDLAVDQLLATALQEGGALLLLDGLDEVKDPFRRRQTVDLVTDFFSLHRDAGNKFVLTSRIVGYREVRPSVTGLQECTLVDLDEDEITSFVHKWTHAIEFAAHGDTPVAREEAAREERDLLTAVENNPGVRRLAANPLLLTILALMKRQGVALPERRVELYENYVQTLLKHWNLARSLHAAQARDLDVKETVRVLAPLALWMHETSPGVGLVKEGDMHRRLEEIFAVRGADDPDAAADRFLDDVRNHAGLLVARGAREYGFIHLTFQEYLAGMAVAMQGQQDVGPVADLLAAHMDDDNWHEVSLLTVGYLGLVQQRDEAADAVLHALMARGPDAGGLAVNLAGDCALDVWPGGITNACRDDVRTALLAAMRERDHVVALPRVKAGRTLAKLDDPRIEVLDPLQMAWCDVPAGPFLMGDDRREYVIPYAYRMGRYPVTNAQFRVFVEDGGYANPAFWREAASEGLWQQGKFQDEAENAGVPEPFSLANHPVAGVTWYEALAFTRWLTDRLHDQGSLSAELMVALPNEPEWEKAARGVDGRIYPWGDEITPEHANYDDTGISTTSAVGAFSVCVGPYGLEDAVGNVLEWTRSLWEKGDDYPAHDHGAFATRERLGAGRSVRRVLRGGSFDFNASAARCAARVYLYPDDWSLRNFGFRVCVVPIHSDL